MSEIRCHTYSLIVQLWENLDLSAPLNPVIQLVLDLLIILPSQQEVCFAPVTPELNKPPTFLHL